MGGVIQPCINGQLDWNTFSSWTDDGKWRALADTGKWRKVVDLATFEENCDSVKESDLDRNWKFLREFAVRLWKLT